MILLFWERCKLLSISISFERVFNFSASVSASYNLIKIKFSSSMSTSRINIWPSLPDSLFLIKSFFRLYETNQNNARVRFTVWVKDAIFKIIFPLNVIIDSWMDFLKKQETIRDNHCVERVHIRSFSCSYFPAFGLNTERYSYHSAEKYGPIKLQIRILFTQRILCLKYLMNFNLSLMDWKPFTLFKTIWIVLAIIFNTAYC